MACIFLGQVLHTVVTTWFSYQTSSEIKLLLSCSNLQVKLDHSLAAAKIRNSWIPLFASPFKTVEDLCSSMFLTTM